MKGRPQGRPFFTFSFSGSVGYMKLSILLIAVFFVCSCSSTPQPQLFSVDLNSPCYEAGAVEAYSDRYLSIGSLKKIPVNVYYYPVEDAVRLQFNIQFVNCNQFWDKAGRDAFVSAFKRYQEEYEQRKLVKGNRRTRGVYGTVQGFFTWKKTRVSVQAHGYPKIKFGYQFRGQTVFFTTTQMESYYEDPLSRSRNQTSPVTIVYFTRAQGEALSALFDQEYLRSLGQGLKSPGNEELDAY
jgi:hypothetical protein